jgi:hypothetical protein
MVDERRTNETDRWGIPERSRSLARVVVWAIDAAVEPRTTADLSALAGRRGLRVSPRTLRAWSLLEATTVQAVLDFIHVARAIVLAAENGSDLSVCLDVREPRTVTRLLARGGLDEWARTPAPTFDGFCAAQRYIGSRLVVEEILRRRSIPEGEA